MASSNPDERKRIASSGGYAMWAGVADRNERLANAHNNSPSGYNWHARRLFGADVDLDALTDTQWEQVEAARRAWLKAAALKAGRANRRKRAQRLREKADRIDAEAAERGDPL